MFLDMKFCSYMAIIFYRNTTKNTAAVAVFFCLKFYQKWCRGGIYINRIPPLHHFSTLKFRAKTRAKPEPKPEQNQSKTRASARSWGRVPKPQFKSKEHVSTTFGGRGEEHPAPRTRITTERASQGWRAPLDKHRAKSWHMSVSCGVRVVMSR